MGFWLKNTILKPDSKYKISLNGGFYYNNEIFFSIAFQQLRKSSLRLFHCLLNEARYGKDKKNKRVYLNNGSISFTESQYKEVFGSSSSYLSARNQLIECGFIKQTYRGGKYRGDVAQYKILCLSDVPYSEQRWKDYPEKKWINEIPKIKKYQIGTNTRWKKGKSGRNLRNTL